MPVKKHSQSAAKKPDLAAVEALADQLADRPYGDTPPSPPVIPAAVVPAKAKPITISLPPHTIIELEEQVMENKRSGEGPRTVSGLIKLALKHYGYKL